MKTEIVKDEKTAIRNKIARAELQRERLAEIESRIFEKALSVLEGAADWLELDPNNLSEVPESWISKYGKEDAEKRHRAAYASWLSTKDAPVGLKLQKDILIGMMKVRAAVKRPRLTLNVKEVTMISPEVIERQKKYEKIQVDE